MTQPNQIRFDVDVLFSRIAKRATEAALSATHGALFARAFLEEHNTAIDRAARRLMHGRSKAATMHDIQAIQERYLRP